MNSWIFYLKHRPTVVEILFCRKYPAKRISSNQSDVNEDSNKTNNDSINGNSADDIPSTTQLKSNSKSSQPKTPKSTRKTGKLLCKFIW